MASLWSESIRSLKRRTWCTSLVLAMALLAGADQRRETMATIGCPGFFREELRLSGPKMIVRAYSFDGQPPPLFQLESAAADVDALLKSAVQASLQLPDAQDEVDEDWTGIWWKLTTPEHKRHLITDEQIDESPDVATAWRKLDRAANLTKQSVQQWLKLSKTELAAGRLDRAFQYAQAAFERCRPPYLLTTGKSDASLKVAALRADFESGNKADACRGMYEIVNDCLSRLPAGLDEPSQ